MKHMHNHYLQTILDIVFINNKIKGEIKLERKLHIKIDTFDEIKTFAKDVTSFESNINISKGSYTYDAKSIMAIFALGTLDDVCVEILSDNEKEIEWFNYVMDKYLIK